jgi:methionyl-tRNA formyltransferase
VNDIKIVFFAANTPRSRAYAQAFKEKGIRIARTIVFDRVGSKQPGKSESTHQAHDLGGLMVPDTSIPLEETCLQISDEIQYVEAESINDAAVLALVKKARDEGFDFVIYSGYGGQIVSTQVLDVGLPFLHAHSGWLPDYPGSTTVYYSLIDKKGCGVSVIELAPDIDQGPILARRSYPAPSASVDIDYLYDSAIRSDILSDVVRDWCQSGRPDEFLRPAGEPDWNYYVIHPLLKHIALLSLEK